MYTQALNQKDAPAPDRGAGRRAANARFEARVDAEDKIEPNDWMPDGLSQDAGPADLPARPFRDHRHAAGGQLDHPRARLRRKAALLAKVQDEAGHGLYLYAAAETLGVVARGAGRAAARRQGRSTPRSSTIRR